MNVLLFLVPISLLLVGLALAVFAWAARSGQFDDLDTPALDILGDDAPATRRTSSADAHIAGTTDAD